MRPLDKGAVPTDAAGNAITPTDYKQWRARLIERIGYYCAYCNQPLDHSLQIEHVIPQNPPLGFTKGDGLAWNNMLLACGPCNNAKDNTPITTAEYYLPETHNTHLPFEIMGATGRGDHAIVAVRGGVTAAQTTKANYTIELLKLQNIDDREAVVDIRSMKRKAAMAAVSASKRMFDENKSTAAFDILNAAEGIVIVAQCIGFFSLWYEAFLYEPEVMQRLTDNTIIPGTAQNCFDPLSGYRPIARNPASALDPF